MGKNENRTFMVDFGGTEKNSSYPYPSLTNSITAPRITSIRLDLSSS